MSSFYRKYSLIQTYSLVIIDVLCVLVSYLVSYTIRYQGTQHMGQVDFAICLLFVLYCVLYDLLTGRLEMVWEYAPVSKWTLFPGSTSLSFVDNGFACIFYSYGIVIGITYIVLLLYMIYHMYKTGNGVAVVFLVTVIFSTLMESTFILNTSLLCNPMLFLLFNEWYRPNAIKKIEVSA